MVFALRHFKFGVLQLHNIFSAVTIGCVRHCVLLRGEGIISLRVIGRYLIIGRNGMTADVYDDFYRRVRNYTKLITRRICAASVNRKQIDKIEENVLSKVVENLHIFINNSISISKLNPRVCRYLDSYICRTLSDYLDD